MISLWFSLILKKMLVESAKFDENARICRLKKWTIETDILK